MCIQCNDDALISALADWAVPADAEFGIARAEIKETTWRMDIRGGLITEFTEVQQ